MADEDTLTPAEMLERIDVSWGAFRQALAPFARSDGLERALADGWTAKGHAAHITAWERSLLALLAGTSRSAAMGLSESVYEEGGVDAVNTALAERADGAPASQVLRELDEVHAELRTVLSAMSIEEISAPYSRYQPDDPPYNESPVIRWIAGNTWVHYDDHTGWLKRDG